MVPAPVTWNAVHELRSRKSACASRPSAVNGETDDRDFDRRYGTNRGVRAQVPAVFAPDMIWRIEGHSAASKEYGSKQQFIDEVLTPFGARFTTSEPFRPVAIRSVYADGDTVIVVWDGRGIATRRTALREQLRLDHETE
jgi:ketosteroid isomerase-like protein